MAAESYAQPISGARAREIEDKVSYVSRWLAVWIALLVVATLTVVAFLIIIAIALHDVNANVAVADRQVRAVRANTSILPGQVTTVNSHLAAINQNLDAIPGQVRSVNGSLHSVNGNLAGTNSSLIDTANTLPTTQNLLASTNGALGTIDTSLQNTNGTLKDTENLLVSVQGLAGKIEPTLEDAESPPNPLPDGLPVSGGAQGIYQRVAVANSVLAPAQQDAGNILSSLVVVNGHLHSTCEALLLQVLGLLPPRPGLLVPC